MKEGVSPVVLFVVYASAVWILAFRGRRRLDGLLAVVLGMLGLVLLARLHIALDRWSDHTIFLPVLQALLFPYMGLVGAMGLYLWATPRQPSPALPCRHCSYDLAGLDQMGLVCPECGTAHEVPTRGSACEVCGHSLAGRPGRRGTCPACSTRYRRTSGGLRRRPSQPAPMIVVRASSPRAETISRLPPGRLAEQDAAAARAPAPASHARSKPD